jgi:Ca-activated chloride channel family protein
MARNLHVRADRSLVRASGGSRRHLCVDVVAPRRHERRPVSLGLVLDQSGSMAGPKMQLAKEGAIRAIRSLHDEDRLSVVAYNEAAHLLIRTTPASPSAKRVGEQRLQQAHPGGNTDLCQGWLRGCEQVGLGLDEIRLGRCLLLTDGLANEGVTDHATLVRHAAELRQRGVTTSTLGVGRDFDEGLLRRMAEAGGGNFYFAQYATQLSDFIAGETGESLRVVARDAALVVDLPAGASLTSPNPFRIRTESGRSVVELGELVADQVLSLVFTIEFPPGPVGGTMPVQCWLWDAEGVLDGVAAEHAFTYESSNACDAEARDPEVEHQMAFTYAAAARQKAAELVRKGVLDEGREALRKMAQNFRRASRDPRVVEIAASLEREADSLGEMDSEESKRVEYSTFGTLHSRGADGMSLGTVAFTAGRTLGALLHAERYGHPRAPLHVIVVTADRVGTRLVEAAGRALAAAEPESFAYTIVDSATCVLDPGPGIAIADDDESALVYAVAASGDAPKLAIVHGTFEDAAVWHWHPTERVTVASLVGWDETPGGSAEALVAWQMVLQATRRNGSGLLRPVHEERRGCWGDAVSTPADVQAMLRLGRFCPDCLGVYERSGVDTRQLVRLAATVRTLATATRKAN